MGSMRTRVKAISDSWEVRMRMCGGMVGFVCGRCVKGKVLSAWLRQ